MPLVFDKPKKYLNKSIFYSLRGFCCSKMEQSQKRQVAYKVRINNILKGKYTKEEGEWVPNYIMIGDKKVSRVNLIAVVVSKESLEENSRQSLLIDDGSGRIQVRSFEEQNNFDELSIGDIVHIIGRPREYFSEKYIVSEIIKKIENPLWAEVRKLEVGGNKDLKEQDAPAEPEISGGEEGIGNSKTEDDTNRKVFDMIKEIDEGAGADIQDIITRLEVDGAERIITRLLEQGEVFEIKPGRIKVLE